MRLQHRPADALHAAARTRVQQGWSAATVGLPPAGTEGGGGAQNFVIVEFMAAGEPHTAKIQHRQF
jgi:hypothetical protein